MSDKFGLFFGKPELRRSTRRRDDRVGTLDGVLVITIFLLLLGIGVSVGYALRIYHETPEPAHRVALQPAGAEKRWIEQRHKYHNIWISIEENGEHYFYRDGKKCKL